MVAVGDRPGRGRQHDDQPAAAAARPGRRRPRRRRPARRRAVGPGLPALPVARPRRRRACGWSSTCSSAPESATTSLFTLPGGHAAGVGGRRPARRPGDARGAARGGCYDGLRLATMLVCVGAANALANPKRLLRAVPGALYEIGSPSSWSRCRSRPQLAESVQRVRAARRLRGAPAAGPRGRAASPCRCSRTRWSGRCSWPRRWTRAATAAPATSRARTAGSPALLTLGGLLGVCVGIYGLLDAHDPGATWACRCCVVGLALAGVGLWLGGRRVGAARYRPDRWRRAEWRRRRLRARRGRGCSSDALAVDPAEPHSVAHAARGGRRCRCRPPLGMLVAVLPAWLTPPAARGRRRVTPTAAARERGAAPVADRVIRFEQVTVTLPRRRPARRCATSTSTVARGRAGAWSSAAPARASRRCSARVNGLVPHFTGGTLAGRVTVARPRHPRPPAARPRRRGRRRRPGPARRLRHRHRRGRARLRHGAARRARRDVMRKRVEETLDLLGIAELRRRPLRDAVRRPAAAGRDRLGADRRTRGCWCSTSRRRRSTRPRPRRCSPRSRGWSTTSASPCVMAEHRLERVVQYADRCVPSARRRPRCVRAARRRCWPTRRSRRRWSSSAGSPAGRRCRCRCATRAGAAGDAARPASPHARHDARLARRHAGRRRAGRLAASSCGTRPTCVAVAGRRPGRCAPARSSR